MALSPFTVDLRNTISQTTDVSSPPRYKGADTITDGDGDNTIKGGGGADTITSGLGTDTVTGGLGGTISRSLPFQQPPLSVDDITDFTVADDQVVLTSLTSRPSRTPLQWST